MNAPEPFDDADLDAEEPVGLGRRVMRVALWSIGALAVCGALWLIVKGLLTERGSTKAAVQQVVIMRPPPPPPPAAERPAEAARAEAERGSEDR
ncbi:MAG: hypothetical protein H7125_16650 [Proteobacteria bacterium]|nr:hypothetical protein [Burkholderiales bacterium]